MCQKGVLIMSEYRPYTPINMEQRQVDELVIPCSDHRFQHAFEAILKSNGVTSADRITYPGPSIAVGNGTLLPAIEKLHSLHDFGTVRILDHTDCGAFGGLEAFNGDELQEAEEHYRRLTIARQAIHTVLPHITVVEHVVGIEEEVIRADKDVVSVRYKR
jgi:hypothetical protein